MAIMKVCSVFDEKAEAFNPPMFVPAVGVAGRDFTNALEDEKLKAHKSDYKLYEVAEFDSNTGAFTSVIPPRLIMSGSDIGG